jgi:hypothetical protein
MPMYKSRGLILITVQNTESYYAVFFRDIKQDGKKVIDANTSITFFPS